MIELRVASKNIGKWKEFAELLTPAFRCLPFDPAAPEVDEIGSTYTENALLKAKGFFQYYQQPVLADDSGLEIDVLQGAPGVLSARWGGGSLSWSERFAFLYNQLRPFPPAQWTARFRTVLCWVGGAGQPLFFEGVTEGKIQLAPSGAQGFGYDPVFFSCDLGKSFGEATDAEKSQVSHRARAVAAFLEWVQKNPHKLS